MRVVCCDSDAGRADVHGRSIDPEPASWEKNLSPPEPGPGAAFPAFRALPVDSAWQQRRRLAGAVREFVNQLIGVEMTEQELREAADRFEHSARELAERPHRNLRHAIERFQRGGTAAELAEIAWQLDFAPQLGHCNPMAAPVRIWQSDGEARGAVRFTAMHEGPPDQVNGGYVAAALDEVLAGAAALCGLASRTVRLSVSYRSPTPLHRDLTLRGALIRVEGRKILTSGSLFDAERLLADAEGLFIALREGPGPSQT